MKVLMIHAYYVQRGGEDVIFEQEHKLMDLTEDVRIMPFYNRSGIRGMLQFVFSIWNVSAAKKIRFAIKECRPDVIHLHNWHFSIGPVAVRVAKNAGIPIVLTINNYRLLCPSATFLHEGQLFTDSIQASFPWKAIAKKVYRNSFFLTFWLAFIIWFHRKIGTWKLVDTYIVNTDFSKSIFAGSSFGVPAEKFVVKTNFVSPPSGTSLKRGDHFLFIGRLSPEKGIPMLMDAFSQTKFDLHIAGDGPLKDLVRKACEQNPHLKFLGPLDKTGVEKAMRECKALIFPSVWYEGMPMTIVEAFSAGTPVIASNLGAMSSMIEHGYNGLHFEKGNIAGLNERLNAWYNLDEQEVEKYRKNVLATFDAHYTAEKNKEQLINIYKSITHAKATD